MNEYLEVNLNEDKENEFHDMVVNKAKEGLSITQIKDQLLDDLASAESFTKGDFIKSEISGGLTKSGNPELIEFYIEKVETVETPNMLTTFINVSI